MARYRATFEFDAYDRADAAHWVRWVLSHYARDGFCDIESLERVSQWEARRETDNLSSENDDDQSARPLKLIGPSSPPDAC